MKNKSKVIKIIIAAVVTVGIVLSVKYFFTAGEYTIKCTPAGETLIMGDNLFDNIGEYEEISYRLHHKNMWIFSSDATALKISYTADNYSKEKEKINSEYTFLPAPDYNEYEDSLITQNAFFMNDWEIKVTQFGDYEYPKLFRMIGFNDNKNEIVYLDFRDGDLDCISTSMQEFIDDYFGSSFKYN